MSLRAIVGLFLPRRVIGTSTTSTLFRLRPLLLSQMNRYAKSSGFSSSPEEEAYMSSLVVQHDVKRTRFFITFDESPDEDAAIEYGILRPRVLDFSFTHVPAVVQGRGVGKRMAKEAFDYVVSRDYEMRVSCQFLQRYLKEYPIPTYLARVVPY